MVNQKLYYTRKKHKKRIKTFHKNKFHNRRTHKKITIDIKTTRNNKFRNKKRTIGGFGVKPEISFEIERYIDAKIEIIINKKKSFVFSEFVILNYKKVFFQLFAKVRLIKGNQSSMLNTHDDKDKNVHMWTPVKSFYKQIIETNSLVTYCSFYDNVIENNFDNINNSTNAPQHIRKYMFIALNKNNNYFNSFVEQNPDLKNKNNTKNSMLTNSQILTQKEEKDVVYKPINEKSKTMTFVFTLKDLIPVENINQLEKNVSRDTNETKNIKQKEYNLYSLSYDLNNLIIENDNKIEKNKLDEQNKENVTNLYNKLRAEIAINNQEYDTFKKTVVVVDEEETTTYDYVISTNLELKEQIIRFLM
jgi:hypothetical protein